MVFSENVGEISKFSSDEYSLTCNWELPNCFAQYEALDTRIVSSPSFKAFSRHWCLALIVNGRKANSVRQGVYLSLGFFLWKMATSKEISDVKVQLIALDRDGNPYKTCDGELDLNGRFGNWDFLSLNTIFTQKGNLSPSGFLTLRCIIKKVPVIFNIPDGSGCSGILNTENNQDVKSRKDESNNQNEASGEDKISNDEYIGNEEDISSDEDLNSDEENKEKDGVSSKFKGIKLLSENLKQVLIDERMTDAVLTVDNREFKVHKIILVARSPVFASMFEHDMAEKKDNEVDIPDCTAESFEIFLHYLYSGSVEMLSASNVYKVYYAADKYRVDDLKEKCVKFMIKNISVETFCDVIALSLRHSESKLQKRATDFFCQNIKKITKTVQWQKYMDENSTQANELLIKALNA